MADEEKFSISKMFSGFSNRVTWAKAFVFGVCIFIIVGIGFAIYRAYINPPKTKTIAADTVHEQTFSPAPTFGGCASTSVKNYYSGRLVGIGTVKK